MKRAEYFYMGKVERELQKKIEDLIIDCKLEVSSIGIEHMEVNDLKMMNAYIKSKLEVMKPTPHFNTVVTFAVAIITIMLTTVLTINVKGNAPFVVIMCSGIFAVVFFSFWFLEKRFKKSLESGHYLLNLLDIYIEEKEEEEKRIDKI
ncbi:hypothetical protein LKM00_10545 [Bacillus wiedmannii]|uniref:hypothetical protein n=1 Tax=Bacillus wiedmannii TaxID=1890302 RepID=UPI00019FE452|nr:hypothetical protein [Bacillus wiedmannii]EEK68612.1 hypothetical protein bcere0006_11260 [Bacillus wiedmannii]MCC2377889.1 hypothetical protein [Bacillus wiedmannii]MCC2421297.1 hypothetical protein [Bacillus wiedmannii]